MLAALLLSAPAQVVSGGGAWLPRRKRKEWERRQRQLERARVEFDKEKDRKSESLRQTIERIYDELHGITSAKPQVEALVKPFTKQPERPATAENIDFSLLIQQFTIIRQLFIIYERELDDELALMLLLD